MKKFVAVLSSILLFVFISGTIMAQEWSKEDKELWKTIEDSWKKWQDKDVEGTLALFHDQYLGWRNEAPMPSDKERVKKMFTWMAEKGEIRYMDLQPVRIAMTKNAAVVHYHYAIMGVWGDKEEYIKGTNSEFYVKENGEWLLLGDFTYEMEEDHDH